MIESDEAVNQDRAVLVGHSTGLGRIRDHDVIDSYRLSQARLRAQVLRRILSQSVPMAEFDTRGLQIVPNR